ncbi:MAG: polysaccharide deacetylase [Alphaproteobacteria bacterium]|nr:polysaccharide deacetylase [Alphaproteobacteria bacterium]
MAALALAACGFSAAFAEEQSQIERCWTQEALAHTDKELGPSRGVRFDLAALKQETLDPAVPVAPGLRGSIRSVELPAGEKLIALTFDLCESGVSVAGYDGRIIDLLRKESIKATFFVSGKWLETHPERAQQLIADRNFEIGAHGLRHLDFSAISDRALHEEIVLPEAAFTRSRNALMARPCMSGVPEAEIPPLWMTLMRFPYGRCNAKSLAAVAEAGQLAIQWDVISGDPDPHISAKGIANNILTRAHPGAIVVAHANGRGRKTADALAIVLPKLKEQGYSFVTVSELLAAGKPVITTKCYINNPGDVTRVARKSRKRNNDAAFFRRKR